ncbi:MAG: exodeoxyribonuclease III [Kiloniellales bacterium]|nr:exodeoxyribonuclease III [Kiloniellales bacterium]
MALRIATWNVNSLRQRLDHLARLSEEQNPDVICMQETKVRDEDFPIEPVRDLGYRHILIHGQKSYNGVAIASRLPFQAEEKRIWCAKDDRRHVSVKFEGGLELHNFYVPSGGAIPDPIKNDKFAHKLQFLTEMAAWASSEHLKSRKAVLVGDMNVAPLEWDVWNHKKLLKSVGHTPQESALMEDLWKSADLLDVPRFFTPTPQHLYSWWGYRYPQAFDKDYGWRLDHVLITPPLAGSVKNLKTLREARAWDKPSDHVPILLDIL